VRRAGLVLLAVAALAAGCGDDDEDAGGGAATTTPPDAGQINDRCGLPAPESGSPPEGLLPRGLLPAGAFVSRWEGEQSATVLLRGSINDAYTALLRSAGDQGYEIEFKEVETLDAEVEVVAGDEVIRFALGRPPSCADVTRAVVTKRPA
jgi:hypothetical protein